MAKRKRGDDPYLMQDLNSGKEWSEMDIADLTNWIQGNQQSAVCRSS
jgi:hypothetical protein